VPDYMGCPQKEGKETVKRVSYAEVENISTDTERREVSLLYG